MNPSADHILIVDDDRDIRQLLADYLEKQGLRCTTAADGREMKAATVERSSPRPGCDDLPPPISRQIRVKGRP